MRRKLLLYLLILTTCFNLAGGYAAAASLKAASFSVYTLGQQTTANTETTVKKASSDLVLIAMAVSKEADEEQHKNFNPDLLLPTSAFLGFLPMLRAGPVAKTSAFSSVPKTNSTPLFVLNCNFRL